MGQSSLINPTVMPLEGCSSLTGHVTCCVGVGIYLVQYNSSNYISSVASVREVTSFK